MKVSKKEFEIIEFKGYHWIANWGNGGWWGTKQYEAIKILEIKIELEMQSWMKKPSFWGYVEFINRNEKTKKVRIPRETYIELIKHLGWKSHENI